MCNWMEICRAHGLRFLDGTAPPHLSIFGFIMGRDALSVYPIGAYEINGDVVIYPPHTLNPTEDDRLTAVATGLTRSWGKSGIITLRFAKQKDGGDFAVLDVSEELGAETKHMLKIRGLEEDFLNAANENPPELLEMSNVGVSAGGKLYTAVSIREALMLLPKAARASLTGWFEKIL